MNKVILPSYNIIPDVGLYLDQTVRFLNEYTAAFGEELTGSMVTNYVKLKIVPKAKGKLYNREQIALFILVALCKKVLSMDQIKKLVGYMNDDLEECYKTFVSILEGDRTVDNSQQEMILKICDIILQKRELDEIIAGM